MACYQCIDCEQYYCARCDSGEDACGECRTGPRCVDCAYDHEVEEHGDNEDDEDEDNDEDEEEEEDDEED